MRFVVSVSALVLIGACVFAAPRPGSAAPTRYYRFAARIPGGPGVTGRSHSKRGARDGREVLSHLPMRAAWPQGASSNHWTRNVFHVHGYRVVVEVRLYDGQYNPVARLKGVG